MAEELSPVSGSARDSFALQPTAKCLVSLYLKVYISLTFTFFLPTL